MRHPLSCRPNQFLQFGDVFLVYSAAQQGISPMFRPRVYKGPFVPIMYIMSNCKLAFRGCHLAERHAILELRAFNEDPLKYG
jgi:hypothetical protein